MTTFIYQEGEHPSHRVDTRMSRMTYCQDGFIELQEFPIQIETYQFKTVFPIMIIEVITYKTRGQCICLFIQPHAKTCHPESQYSILKNIAFISLEIKMNLFTHSLSVRGTSWSISIIYSCGEVFIDIWIMPFELAGKDWPEWWVCGGWPGWAPFSYFTSCSN